MKNLEQIKTVLLTHEQVKLAQIRGGTMSFVDIVDDDKRRERPGTTRS